MQFIETTICGAYAVELHLIADARGAFARTYCREEFLAAGIAFQPVQCNVSMNTAGTLRGMHYQRHPHSEPKLVQCVRGEIFDVAIDLRSSSPTFGAVAEMTLAQSSERLFYIPAGCAHGFLTLSADSAVIYYMGAPYVEDAAAGVRWNDPAFRIAWPSEPAALSDRDRSWSDFDPAAHSCP